MFLDVPSADFILSEFIHIRWDLATVIFGKSLLNCFESTIRIPGLRSVVAFMNMRIRIVRAPHDGVDVNSGIATWRSLSSNVLDVESRIADSNVHQHYQFIPPLCHYININMFSNYIISLLFSNVKFASDFFHYSRLYYLLFNHLHNSYIIFDN